MNVVILWLTKLYLRSVGGKFTRTQVVSILDEKEQEIIVFSSDKFPSFGQRTLFGTTIVSESVFSNELLLKYVVLHETGHKKQWYGYFIYPLTIVCVLALFGFILGALLSLLGFITSLQLSYLLATLLGLGFAAFSLVILGVYSWILELNAEFYAIRKLGLKGFLDARSTMPKQQKRPLLMRFFILVTHPPLGVTIRLYNYLHRKNQK